jgi:hypothetical protein
VEADAGSLETAHEYHGVVDAFGDLLGGEVAEATDGLLTRGADPGGQVAWWAVVADGAGGDPVAGSVFGVLCGISAE